MDLIRILDSDLHRLGVISKVIDAARTEVINDENTLDLTVIMDSKMNTLLNEDSILEFKGQYFDVKVFKKLLNSDGSYTIVVESEHVSYRLNEAQYNVEFFTEYGTPPYIIGQILAGTPFSLGTCDFSNVVTYSAQEAMSRRQVLMEFAQYIDAELLFDGWTISCLQHLGSTEPKLVVKDRDVTVLSKVVNKRELVGGLPKVSYACTPVHTPLDNFELGDNIQLRQVELGISESLRCVKIIYNPYDDMATTFEFSDHIGDLSNSIYDIQTDAVSKDAKYNGIRIGPEYGFEAVRNDKRARAYFRSDAMVFQSGDGNLVSPTWKDRLYYEYDSELDETTLVFDGKFTVDVLEALSAVITPNLYAEKGYISELTVDQLETSNKVQKYLNGDTSDVNFIRIVGQVVQFITAKVGSAFKGTKSFSGQWDMQSDLEIDTYYTSITIDDEGVPSYSNGGESSALAAFQAGRIYRPSNPTSYYKLTGVVSGRYVKYDYYIISEGGDPYEQATNRNGQLLYWKDEDHQITVTEETEFPCYIYTYAETVKMENSFTYDSTLEEYIPRINIGAGGGGNTNGSGSIYKGDKGLYVDYYNSQDGDLRQMLMNDDGVKFTPSLNLYGAKGNIAELTVDRYEGSNKVQKYLDSDTSDINYVRIKDQYISFITASYNSGEQQLANRDEEPLYWTDDTRTDVTVKSVNCYGEDNEPVMIYTYDELIKMEFQFIFDDEIETFVPVLVLGSGTGVDSNAQAHIYKREDGLHIVYYHSENGTPRRMSLLDTGIEFDPPVVGNSDIMSTTLGVSITSSGEFVTDEWSHGFDSAQDLIQFLVTPKFYDNAQIKLRDIRVEETSATTCRIRGYAELI
ncbi:MAG: hypothetical protein PHQ86_04545 [Dehalococcoidales bacterium]|nr:hypothetical protein [Dehalococcoidales bacterium]